MFDKAIIDTDKFMDLGMTSKAMYFLLGMEADDEGFVSYKKVLRIHGGNEDDVKVLVAKGFLISFPSGVVVVTDWNKNNWLDSRRLRPTEYQKEKSLLALTSEKMYVLSNGLASAKPEERSIEENSLTEAKASAVEYEVVPDLEVKKKPPSRTKDIESVFRLFKNPAWQTWKVRPLERKAAEVLFDTYGLEVLTKRLARIEKEKQNKDPYFPEVNTPSQLLDKMPNIERYLNV